MLLIFFYLWVCASVTVAQVCNGYAELCGRKWSNVSQIGTHDSAFVGELPTQNQDIDVTAQLSAGVRFLQAQTHYFVDELRLCHTSCWEEDSGPAVNYLSDIKKWLDANPNDVVTLLLTNGDYVPVGNFSAVMEASGLAGYAYTPPHQLAIDQWPTLQEMITAGHRLVMFLDYDANTNVAPYILPEFSYFFETAYDTTDSTFSTCKLDRPPGSNGDGLLPLINHYLDVDVLGILIPDRLAAAKTNAATGVGSIGAQADLCTATWGRKPRVMLLDYFNTGKKSSTPPTHDHNLMIKNKNRQCISSAKHSEWP
ncbi:hypothetical protein DSL72_006599 [Monilinia vaccinii-corymbosi]|uniref:Phosphatidylinositol-specific phospholipase C X domain-containing protein n=1 Tax=Monilinia vaccinii-corymbosi TaxID=61207 RepID=A0A8A3PPG7_9HELO|nr:hypothetical protein DSL72_006599 [Monilinia vaccinii-corymbosi]